MASLNKQHRRAQRAKGKQTCLQHAGANNPAYKARPLKNLFTANQCWPDLLDAGGLRNIEVEAVTKMLACGTSILGVKQYTCANDGCPHAKYLCNTCKCRACPSCGKKATDQWIAAQHNRLPDCPWQHLVFTLPDILWPLFYHNRDVLNDICRLAVDNLLYAARKRGLEIDIFCAIHTYGRRLNMASPCACLCHLRWD